MSNPQFNSIKELNLRNNIKAIIDKYGLAAELHGIKPEYYVTEKQNLFNVVDEIMQLLAPTDLLYNFGKGTPPPVDNK